MQEVALITGAPSGIGKELARIHASHGGDLVVVARREDALLALKSELEEKYGFSVRCQAADLTQPNAPRQLYDWVSDSQIAVQYLVNNAGFGGHGYFHERNWQRDHDMIQLNVVALTESTRLFLPDMVTRKSGRVLNTASTAAFLPGPLQSVYYATKAYVVSWSQALDEEMRSLGVDVTITALCPGAVATEFVAAADLHGNEMWNNAATPASVAEVGYNAMMRGKLIEINDWKLRFALHWIIPFLPRRMVLRMSRKSMETNESLASI